MAEKILVAKVSYRPKAEVLKSAQVILGNCQRTVESLLGAFDRPGGSPRPHRAPTDPEQDILRAMVLFASAGTDAMVKQVVKDSLGIAISIMPSARKALTEHVAKRILRKTTVGESVDAIFLSEVLINENRTDALIQQLIKHLIAGSLQSTPELLKVAAVFSIKPKDLLSDVSKLDDAFTARNYIAHEMDVDFTQPNRSRRARKRDDMVFMANTLLNVDESFLRAVDSKFTS